MSFAPSALAEYQKYIQQMDPTGQSNAHLIYQPAGAPQTPQKIGILDASFNPMTRAHAALVETAYTTQNLDHMLLLLSVSNVDKKISGATLPQRLAMLMAYAKLHTHLSVAICSHARFIDKVEALKPCLGQNTDFYFIVGYDTLIRLFDSKYYDNMQADLNALFSNCHFIAANRGVNDLETLNAFLARAEVHPFAQNIHPISLPPQFADISSTNVREHIAQNLSISHLVPDPISEAIQALELYAPNT